MIRRLLGFAGCLVLLALGAGPAGAASYALNNGETLEGEPLSFNPQGLIVKKADGSFATRVPWTNFTQNALKQLSANPKIKPLLEPYLEIDEPEPSDARKKKFTADPKIPDRMERPDPKAGLGNLFKNGLTLTLLFLIYAANIYAGFEVAVFRNYPPAVVCGVAAVAPILGLIVFLCMPVRLQKSHDELAAETMAHHAAEAAAHAATHAQAHGGAEAPAEEAASAPAAPAAPQAVVYQRGQTTFNRRFFETKFAGFLRMVPGEAERDKVIQIKSSRGEYVGTRLARVQPAEICLQVTKGGASSEVTIPFTEILEVKIRQREPQDA